ncbi:glutathione S-transferase [Phanerochaete sordida]|uniref:glutathione transferase n=1 Tax=Phanerochaete sordida TaxID=48140 RepID=A0A9P3G809_9APHY|nr:glutathione S-transferase [Phanerochaete sordida]
MSHNKQFTLFMQKTAVHGWKVIFILEELGLTYEKVIIDIWKNEQKAPEFTKYNPNGRTPVLIDHRNNDFVIWESNAILQYLVDKYDTGRRLSVAPGTDEYFTQLQWLYFQGTGQSPYYGQAIWFNLYHAEKIPSAIERYRAEVRRVLGVLEGVLSNQEWLVDGRVTVADVSFVSWNAVIGDTMIENFDFEKEFPVAAKWHNRILERPAIKKAWEERNRLWAEIQRSKD